MRGLYKGANLQTCKPANLKTGKPANSQSSEPAVMGISRISLDSSSLSVWMYPVAHIVVATALTRAGEVALRASEDDRSRGAVAQQGFPIDYRLVALGAWLPDIIDKPMAWSSVPIDWQDDHLFAHTLLFTLIICLPGVWLALRGDLRLLSLGLGALLHRLCDPLFLETEILFWPFLGTEIHEHTTGPGLAHNVQLEMLATAALLLALLALLRSGRLMALIQYGRL